MITGRYCDVDPSVKVAGAVKVTIGDGVYVGPGVRFVGAGTVKFGDYSKVHDGCLIIVPHPHSVVEFGCNTWIGERTVLDGRGGLRASHNVGVGIASHLYTHIAHGDVLAGCKFMSEKPLNIGIDAWFVGQCLVSPVDVGEKSIAMLGSTITKDMEPNTIYAGVPAKEMTEKMGRPWDDRPASERMCVFNTYLDEYNHDLWLRGHTKVDETIKAVTEFPSSVDSDITYFNVVTRTYTKRLTRSEVDFMKWLTSYKGKFTPEGAK